MPEKARSFFKQFGEFWASLPTAKRLALVVVTSLVLLGVLALSVLGSQERYGTLYTELGTGDAAAIVEKLKTAQVPHKLEAGGTAILVPEERIPALRLELAAGGLPHGGSVGFEIFDRSRMGATEFEQQVNLRRALEGELSRSVMSVQGVKGARVHLVLPERRLFAAREESASASVVIKLENSHNFGRREVAAIVHLVAAAVPTLSKDRVSVVSTEGVTLHRPNSDAQGGGDLADLNSEQARVMASQLETDAQAQLERVLGPGNADVRVNLLLDSSAREKTEELYEPTKTALRSEHKVDEGVAAGEAGVAGVPGAKTNLPDAEGEGPVAEAAGPVGGGSGTRTQTRNWEVQKITQKTTTPPGDIRRLSVAVMLNGRYLKKGDKLVFAPLPPEEVKGLEETVKRAVGFNAERGDTVTVQATQFAKLDADGVGAPVGLFGQKPWLPYALGALGLILVLGTLVLVVRPKKGAATGPRTLPQLLDSSAMLAELGPGSAMAAAAAALPSADRKRLLQAPEVAGEIREYALGMAAKDPANAAVVLKAWLADEPAALPSSSAA